MYDAIADPYCYPDTTVLKNIPDLRLQAELDAFEAVSTMQRADEPLPSGNLSVSYYKEIHHHLFQDVYPFAGEFRTVRLAKGGSAFCYPEHIEHQMEVLFQCFSTEHHFRGLAPNEFVHAAAEFLGTLNAVHPFREGNGRTQTLFLTILAGWAGHPLDLGRLEPEAFLNAMVRSFEGDIEPLVTQVQSLLSPTP